MKNSFSNSRGMRAGTGKAAILAVLAAGLALTPLSHAAQDEWTFGIGTGLSSLALDGDVGFATESGGVIEDMDLDNGDTADMFESAFGFTSFANKGPWTIRLGYATLTLEDDNRNFDAEWDRASGELSVEYTLVRGERHSFGVLGGLRYIDHEWEFQDKVTREKLEPDDDYIDGLFGLTHRMPFANNWAWNNRVDYSTGDSEGIVTASTSVSWQPLEHWVFNLSFTYADVELGEAQDNTKPDFYYYDVDESVIGLGFAYTW